MSGQDGLRGYLVQAFVTVIDSLDKDSNWQIVAIEPTHLSEKVDIVWTYPENRKKVVQVKSTRSSFSYADAKKWAIELKESVSDGSEYELFLIGDVQKKLKTFVGKNIDDVLIRQKPLDIEGLNALLSESIDRFFSEKNEDKISFGIRRLISSSLKDRFLENALFGKPLRREELTEVIVNVIREIEKYLKVNHPIVTLIDIADRLEDNNLPTNEYYVSLLMNLLGWKGFNKNETVIEFNEKTEKEDKYSLDFCGYQTSRLSDNEKDFIYIQSLVLDSYKNLSTNVIKSQFKILEKVSPKFKNEQPSEDKIKKIYHSIQFLLSTDIDENSASILSEIKTSYNYPKLLKDYVYYAVDNAQFNFLISSIAHAKLFRPDCTIRYLYPITEHNLSEKKIGNREPYLPPQFINSSVIPIVKESNTEISILLFCKDVFSEINLKKMVWLSIALTSGFTNNYRIYFPNYSNEFDNTVKNILRGFGDDSLVEKVTVDCISNIDFNKLKDIPLNHLEVNHKHEIFDETKLEQNELKKYKPNTDFLINYLPYGSIIKPFLTDERIKSEDLKLFLETKGIFLKNQDKEQIIDIMTKLLFCPSEISNLVGYVVDKKREVKEIEKPPYLKAKNISNSQLYTNLQSQSAEIQKLVKEEFIKKNTELFNFKVEETNIGVEILVAIREKFPNKHAMINEAETTHKLVLRNEDKHITSIREYESEQGRKILQNIQKLVEEKLFKDSIIKEPSSDILFSSFQSNEERTNFLLSFSNVNNNLVFNKSNIKLSKYAFDEKMEIPKELEDKVGKKLRMNISGENLHEVRELQDDDYKRFVLLEKIKVELKFEYKNIKGSLYADIDFSDALKNEPQPDGILTTKTIVLPYSSYKKSIKNIVSFEQEIKGEFSKFKTEKLKQFNLI